MRLYALKTARLQQLFGGEQARVLLARAWPPNPPRFLMNRRLLWTSPIAYVFMRYCVISPKGAKPFVCDASNRGRPALGGFGVADAAYVAEGNPVDVLDPAACCRHLGGCLPMPVRHFTFPTQDSLMISRDGLCFMPLLVL